MSRNNGVFAERKSNYFIHKENIMRKTFELEDLDCANCAAKMENAIRDIDGVTFVSVSFMTQKMILEADDARFDDILKKAIRLCRKIEPDCTVKTK